MRKIILIIAMIPLTQVHGETNRFINTLEPIYGYLFPENYSVRETQRLAIEGDPFVMRKTKTRVVEIPGADYRVKVMVQEQNKAVYLLFINEHRYSFPIYSEGTYIIKRDEISGEIIQIKVFLKSEKDCFLRIFPEGERSSVDLYLYGYPLYRHVLVPKNIRHLATASFSELVAATDRVIDWGIVFPPREDEGYASIARMIEGIREVLSTLPDREDGSMNENGDFVLIETEETVEDGGFNCSGFAKWIVDGLFYPLTETYIPIRRIVGTDGRNGMNRHGTPILDSIGREI